MEEDRTIVGMGALKRHPNGDGEIKRMRVDPGSQRRGIGQEILTALLRTAKERGMQRIYLDTTDRQVAARRLYEKNGFRESGQKPWRGMTLVSYERIEPGKTAGQVPDKVAPEDRGCG